MAITATAVQRGKTYKSWTLTALDADTTTSFAHGFSTTPDFVEIQPLVTYATWGATADATNIILNKSSATASGGATPGTTVIAKVYAMLPHSLLAGLPGPFQE